MSTTQSAPGQAARWKIPLRTSAIILHNPLRPLINVLEWISRNDAANRGLGTLTSLISVCAVVIAVVQYYATSTQRNLQSQTQIWQGLANSTGQGQKAAIQLLATEGFSMASIHLNGADLSTVHIASANLSYSDIEDSNFSNADLAQVEFAGATIRNDDFSYANLTGADLNYLNLNNPAHSNNFSGAIMPLGADLPALEAIACVNTTKSGAIIWPVQNGKSIPWPLDSQDRPQLCTPPKPWQANCASPWCNAALVKKPWYDLSFLLAPLTSATTLPANFYPPITNHPASAPTQKPPPPTTTRQPGQTTFPAI
jgi:hypothetical protein